MMRLLTALATSLLWFLLRTASGFTQASSSSFCKSPTFVTRGGSQYNEAKTTTTLRASTLETSVSADNLQVLSERGREAILSLIEHDADGSQQHVYADWPEPGTDDDGKRRLGDQVMLSAGFSKCFVHTFCF